MIRCTREPLQIWPRVRAGNCSVLMLFCVPAFFVGSSAPQQQAEIKDEAEYYAYVEAVQQRDAAVKISHTEAFVAQYPNSKMREDALELLLVAYKQIGNLAKMTDTAHTLLRNNPGAVCTPRQQRELKDPAEYNAYVGAVQQSDTAAKISGLEAFLRQFPNSVMKEDALEILIVSRQKPGDAGKMLDTVNELFRLNPDNACALALSIVVEGKGSTIVESGSGAKTFQREDRLPADAHPDSFPKKLVSETPGQAGDRHSDLGPGKPNMTETLPQRPPSESASPVVRRSDSEQRPLARSDSTVKEPSQQARDPKDGQPISSWQNPVILAALITASATILAALLAALFKPRVDKGR